MSNDTVIVRPVFATGDRVAIEPLDNTEFLTFGTNSLLNGLNGLLGNLTKQEVQRKILIPITTVPFRQV